MDKHDRYFNERKGTDELKITTINPHRVQMFSINEIWKSIQHRLVELKIIKNPEVDSDEEGEDSAEVDDNYDFEKLVKERVNYLFKGRKNASK